MQNNLLLKAVGLFNNTAYFGFFYGGSKGNPNLHLFGINLEKISFQVPSIDFTSAVYEFHQTNGRLTDMDQKFPYTIVCDKSHSMQVYIYTFEMKEKHIRFYSISENKSTFYSSHLILRKDLRENSLWFIPTDKPSCYERFLPIRNPIFK